MKFKNKGKWQMQFESFNVEWTSIPKCLQTKESAQVNEANPYEKQWYEYVNGTKGSFMKHLANAFMQADIKNHRKLYSAFPEVGKIFMLWKTAGESDKPY